MNGIPIYLCIIIYVLFVIISARSHIAWMYMVVLLYGNMYISIVDQCSSNSNSFDFGFIA
jgi:hypothetical protein